MPFLTQVEQSLLQDGLTLDGLQGYLNTISIFQICISKLVAMSLGY